jgi:hypothetical protein
MSKSFKIPNDFNIYSALSTGKVSDSALTGLFLQRGIILSNKTSRESKADYFSSFMHGYYDFEKISSQHSKIDRVEYTSPLSLEMSLSFSDLTTITTDLVKCLEKNFSNIQLKDVEPDYNINDDIFYITFDYEKFHPEKQMFAQLENKKAILTFKKDKINNEYYVEYPATPEMIKWSTSILGLLQNHDVNMKINSIDLTGLTDPSLYWQFFDELTNTFDNYKRTNVVEVLFKDPNKDDNAEDEGIYQLISATYKGNQLHLSEDFQARLSDGYLLHKFTWDCIDTTNTKSDKFRLSIKVTYDEDGSSHFSFISKGFYKFIKGKHSKSITSLSHLEDNIFNKAIFKNGIALINSLTTLPKINIKSENIPAPKTKDA